MISECQQAARPPATCHSCGKSGHMARDCQERQVRACHTCHKPGHMARECPERQVRTCNVCHKPGHMARDCQERQVRACHICHISGHMARNCPGILVPEPELPDWSVEPYLAGVAPKPQEVEGEWSKPVGEREATGRMTVIMPLTPKRASPEPEEDEANEEDEEDEEHQIWPEVYAYLTAEYGTRFTNSFSIDDMHPGESGARFIWRVEKEFGDDDHVAWREEIASRSIMV